jgi:nicotinate-nucleotide pyrophosphorylase (carboxylating)
MEHDVGIPDEETLVTIVRAALREDHAWEDATTLATVASTQRMRARVVARGAGVLCGQPLATAVFRQLDPDVVLRGKQDGARVTDGEVVWEIDGRAHAILSGERVALNLVQHLSGVATLTGRFVEALTGTGVAVSDTRKTTPLLRVLEKYAVRCGGGVNHRMHLADMLLIKENHIAAAGGIDAALRQAMQAAAGRGVEIEVRSLDELREALPWQPQRVLLDHWSVGDIRTAVALRGDAARPEIEVSGDLDLSSVRRVALPGVAVVSVGRLTHSAPVLDLSLLAENVA